MPATYTQAQLDAVYHAIASGADSVTIGDRTLRNRSLDELMRIANYMEMQMGLKPRKSSTIKIAHSRGTSGGVEGSETLG